jgi:hypothetical protein
MKKSGKRVKNSTDCECKIQTMLGRNAMISQKSSLKGLTSAQIRANTSASMGTTSSSFKEMQ